MAVTITGNTRVIGQTTVGVPNPPLLDVYSGAAAAYSLRKLRTVYTGNAIRVRRSSDNTEQDIGFDVSGNLDETTLLVFVGTGSGFISIWYDQSGNSRNATQTTQANQPRIVNNGSLSRKNNRPAIEYYSNSSGLNILNNAAFNWTNTTAISIISVNSGNKVNSAPRIIEKGGTPNFQTSATNGYLSIINNTFSLTASIDVLNNNLFINQAYCDRNVKADICINNIDSASTTTISGLATSTDNIQLGYATFATRTMIGYFSEVIYYNQSNFNNRFGIQQNINAYYNIY